MSFVATDGLGNFTLDGRPHFLHAAVYFGRRPGTCGADWMGENFGHNLAFMDRDFATMNELGINTLGLFVPARHSFDGLAPMPERLDQLHAVLDKMAEHDLRAIVWASRGISKDVWCAAHGIDPNETPWHPAVNPHAEDLVVASATAWRRHFADRPEVLGWDTGVGRFFRYGFTAEPLRAPWAAWLRERFGGDFARVRELFGLGPDEAAWEGVRTPVETEPYFNEENPRSFEFALMQEVLCRRASARVNERLRPVTPRQLIVEAMEGCCFSTGHLTTIVPEMITADALWLECYHWEGLRSHHLVDEAGLRWMKEPVAEKPSAGIINAAGYVQMLTRWMQRSGKAIIMCHGCDIGEKRRGVRSEQDQAQLLRRYNTFFHASGGHGIAYWCWSDDELSRTFTRTFGVEYDSLTPDEQKKYPQAGETMGIVRYDGSLRPVTDHIRGLSKRLRGRARVQTPAQVLVLFPCPMLQSLHRYRSNVTGFGIFTSLARQGILAEAAMTSAGEELLRPETLAPYRLLILGANEYVRDHPEVPGLLVDYVEAGGALLLPLGAPATLADPYVKRRRAPALRRLSGCARLLGRRPANAVEDVRGEHPAFEPSATPSWALEMDEQPTLTRVRPVDGAEVLARAGKAPLLYRHRLGKGTVYVFTWNLDVFVWRGAEVDYAGGHWDWLWRGLAAELGLKQDLQNEIVQVIREMEEQAG
jgi:hypothetical protein